MPEKRKKININLIIKKDEDINYSGQLLSWAIKYGRYIIILTQIFVLSVFFLRFKLDRDHTDLKDSVTQKQAIVESITDLETEIKHVQNVISHVKEITSNQDLIQKIVFLLEQITPSDMIYSKLSITNQEISFEASALNLKSFNYLLKKLLSENKFSDITLTSITRRIDGRIEFSLSAKINKSGFI
jgi:hypothetical protein